MNNQQINPIPHRALTWPSEVLCYYHQAGAEHPQRNNSNPATPSDRTTQSYLQLCLVRCFLSSFNAHTEHCGHRGHVFGIITRSTTLRCSPLIHIGLLGEYWIPSSQPDTIIRITRQGITNHLYQEVWSLSLSMR